MEAMPEQELWKAVIRQAAEDARGEGLRDAPADAARRIIDDARSWVGSDDFVEVCDLAGEDPDTVAKVFPRGPSGHGAEPDRYMGLPDAAVDEVLGTRLDRSAYLDVLRDQEDAAARARDDLDRGLGVREAITGG